MFETAPNWISQRFIEGRFQPDFGRAQLCLKPVKMLAKH